MTTHNLSYSRLYRILGCIKQRCYNKKHIAYKNYGGRGITVCDEWKNDFMSFYNWAINNGYNDNLTIDRIDNNGNYQPDNCKWSTDIEQSNNKRTNHYLEIGGERKTLIQWSREKNIPYDCLISRLRRGVPNDKIFNAVNYKFRNHNSKLRLQNISGK